MGVRTLVGMADGTRKAAAMYDSVSGWMIGPIFEAEDGEEQIEAFLGWLRELRFVEACEEIGLRTEEMPFIGCDGSDPRHWGDRALAKLVKFWRSKNVDEEGLLAGIEH